MQPIFLLPCTKPEMARSCFIERNKEMKVLPAVLSICIAAHISTRTNVLSVDLRGICESLQAHARILHLSKRILYFCPEAKGINPTDGLTLLWARNPFRGNFNHWQVSRYKTNTQFAKELKITLILDKLLEYKRNWIEHVNRMPRNRLPRVGKHYDRLCGLVVRVSGYR